MSTDTAFALGMLALVGPRFPDRLRAFMLTVVVVDDIVAIGVIATVYTTNLVFGYLARRMAPRRAADAAVLGFKWAPVCVTVGLASWVATMESGIDPVVVGLVMGLMTYAYPAARADLERASDLFRMFREQPTPELARSRVDRPRRRDLAERTPPGLFHPWTSFAIVPIFAIANAGIAIDAASSRTPTPRR